MTFISFNQRAKKIHDEKFQPPQELDVVEFAIRRCQFRIQKLSRLIQLARECSNLRLASKKEKLWKGQLARVKKSLGRFENLKGGTNSVLVLLHDLQQHPLVAALLPWECELL